MLFASRHRAAATLLLQAVSAPTHLRSHSPLALSPANPSAGKTGYELGLLGSTFAPWIAGNRSRLPGDPATLPFVVTEHAPHTTATWNTVTSTGDQDWEAARLGSQILFNAAQGFETYVFKFSAAEQSSGITPGCVAQTAPAWTPATACGVQKVGLHWAENQARG